MSIQHVIAGRERDLGGFVVRRVLPYEKRQMVGPFIFFDHLGPAQFAPNTGIDVRPHPHIALATVTYLFEGSLEHRDSLGTVREIRPGDVNWMTAGRGIAHSERTPQAARAAGPRVHGIQSWVALPDGHEDGEATFTHHPAATLPKRAEGGAEITVIAGEAFGLRSPVATLWPTIYAELRLAPDARVEIPSAHEERALYVVEGAIAAGDRVITAGHLAVLEPASSMTIAATREQRAADAGTWGDEHAVDAGKGAGTRTAADGGGAKTEGGQAVGAARLMLLGGARFPTRRFIWWNFVASSPERIEEAKQRWRRGGFAPVPGETESIPLPEG